jgi:hypothetical protein
VSPAYSKTQPTPIFQKSGEADDDDDQGSAAKKAKL